MTGMQDRLHRFGVWIRALLRNATVRYRSSIFVLLLLGIVGEIAGNDDPRFTIIPHALVLSFSEAALLAALLAIIVDPYLKRRLQQESGWGAIFAFLNPKAPSELKEAIQELADCKRYNTTTRWIIEFTWHDEDKTILAVTLQSENTGINLDHSPYRPAAQPWVLASTRGYQTKFLRYSLSCPGHIPPVDVRGDELSPYVVTENNLSIFLDEGRIVGRRRIPPDATFEKVVCTLMYRHSVGYIPLQHGMFAEDLTVELKGSALAEVDVTVSHLERRARKLPHEWKRPASSRTNPDLRRFGRVTPGEVTLVSWSPPSRVYYAPSPP
jgi:hypothetical protein